MKEIRRRETELKITRDEWLATWMLGRIQKRKKVDSHELQTLRNVAQKGGEEVIKNFEDAFKEVRIEGKRKKASVVNYTKSSSSSSTPKDFLKNLKDVVNSTELSLTSPKDPKETLYVGTNFKAR